jgi:serine/threonine protein kinase
VKAVQAQSSKYETCNTSAYIEFSQSVLSDCDNILKNFALYFHQNQFFILQELMLCNLETFIKKVKIIPETVILFILIEVSKGLEYLHHTHKMHRDIKSQNIFISSSGQVKLGDFGCVAQLTQEREMRTTLVGTPLNLAPEIVMGKDYDVKVDIWSLGIVAYEMLFKETPFEASRSIFDLGQKVVNFKLESLKRSNYDRIDEVIRRCLVMNPVLRVSAKELVDWGGCQVNHEECVRFILQSLASE